MFSKFHSNLIIGTTYSGQVLIWDTRNKTSPIQRSIVNSKSHTSPIFGIELVGTKLSHQLITISSDGRICSWTMDKLASPMVHDLPHIVIVFRKH